MTHEVFVYGTLLRGERNHPWLARYVQLIETVTRLLDPAWLWQGAPERDTGHRRVTAQALRFVRNLPREAAHVDADPINRCSDQHARHCLSSLF